MPGTLAIIPAKGSSSRVPHKNLQHLGGRPLFWWTVQAALEARTIERVVVSTESGEVANIARGAHVDVTTHPSLDTDPEPEVPDVVHHVLRELGEPDDTSLVCLLPTSPFRTAEHIDAAVAAHLGWHDPQYPNILTVTEPMHHEGLQVADDGRLTRSPQHVGAILIATAAKFRQDGFFSPRGALPYWLPAQAGFDINTEADLRYARRIAERLKTGVAA